jgi:hypothetical protein
MPFCFLSLFSCGRLDLHLRMATKSWWLEAEAVRCRGRIPQAWEKDSKGQATWALLSPRAERFFEVLYLGDGSTDSAAKDDQGFGYVPVFRA